MKFYFKPLTIFIFILLFLVNAQAQNIIFVDSANVNGPHDGSSWTTAFNEFYDGLDAANTGDQIFVAKGTYEPLVDSNFVIKGGIEVYGGFEGTENSLQDRNLAAGHISILKANGRRVFNNDYPNSSPISLSIIDGFTMRDGDGTGDGYGQSRGGAMYNTNCTLNINNVIFENNNASSGGALHNFNSDITLTNVKFLNNTVYFQGGAIDNLHSKIKIINALFHGNSANEGGAIRNSNSWADTLENIIFSDNVATNLGGAIYSHNQELSLHNNIIYENNSAKIGGALYVYISDIKISNSEFNNNSSTEEGGGFYVYHTDTVLLENISFYQNIAGYSGGGLYTSNPSSYFTMDSLHFENNSAGQSGGGFNVDVPKLYINDVMLKNNTANAGGGALINEAKAMNNVIFESNTANFNGGGIVILGETIASNLTFMDNQANEGGGIYITDAYPNDSKNAQLSNVTLFNNSATTFGGGIYATKATPTLINTVIDNNQALYGGGVFNKEASPIFINNIFHQNTATDGGGILNIEHSNPSIINSNFHANQAHLGAGIYSDLSSPLITNSIFWNNQSNNGNDDIAGGTPTVTYSLTQTNFEGDGNQKVYLNPFEDPNNAVGNDGIWMTEDDGLQLNCFTNAINAGINNSISDITVDILGEDRIYGAYIDLGAYEKYYSSDDFIDRSITVNDQELTANQEGAVYQWGKCDDDFIPINEAINQVYFASDSGKYAVIISKDDCVSISNCIDLATIGIQSVDHKKLKVYPNPTIGKVTIKTEVDIKLIQVYNITGQLIQTLRPLSKNIKIDLSLYQQGMYLIKMQTKDGQTYTAKVLKE